MCSILKLGILNILFNYANPFFVKSSKNPFWKWLFCSVLLGSIFLGCAKKSDQKVIKLGHGLDTEHPVHKGMEHLAKLVKERSGGELTIEIYPSQQLGTERELLELLQIGSVGITKVAASTIENFAPSYQVFSIPFIFKSDEHRFRVLDSEIGQQILRDGEAYWLRGLCYYDAGSRSFYTTEKAVHNPDDLEGLKIRVMESRSAMEMVSTLGGSPTPLAWGELYTALQQGVVDGAENNAPSFYLSRHYEVSKYYTINQHTAVPDVLVISTHIWNSLSAEHQTILQQAAIESAHYQKKLWAEATDKAMAAVTEAGVEIIFPDKKVFQDKVAPLYKKYESDERIGPLLKAIQKMD